MTAEFPFDLWLIQKYFPVGQLAFGLYPTQFDSPSTAPFVDTQLDGFERFGADWISIWVLNPGSAQCPTMADVHRRWAPWLGWLKRFLSGGG